MAYLGNQPALSYTSFAKQDFTTSATTSYTLDNPVANANELALFINFVRQEPTTAYTASGTSLTLTSATSASDDMYCVYLGKAVQTVTPANNSVTGDMLSKPFNYDSGTLYLDDTNNRVGIGTSSPDSRLEVLDSSATGIISRSTSTQATDTNKALRVRNNSDTDTFAVSYKGSVFLGSGTGIYFDGSTSGNNQLDDYEEGTWTPTTNIGFNTIYDASYVKIGQLVFVNLSAQTNTGPQDVAQATSVGGLPFACRTGNAVSNSVVIEGLNQDVYAEIAGSSYSQIDKANGTPITRNEFGNQRVCRTTLVYSIA
jgi:hypothetical protein